MGRTKREVREEVQQQRQWRGSPVSRGFHGNRLNQPVAAILVMISHIWQHGELGSGIHQSNLCGKKKSNKILQCCSFVNAVVQIEDILRHP